MAEAIRLNKYLADVGVCSRREADRLIEEGKVFVDGVAAVMGTKVEPGTRTLATGMPRVRTPWNRKVPMSTWLILQRVVEAPPIRMADAATKPI